MSDPVDALLDDVEKTLTPIAEESMTVHGALSTLDATGDYQLIDLNKVFWHLVKWWFRKKKKYLTYLNKLMTLPMGARAMNENTASFYVLNNKGEKVEIKVKYSGYDLLEFLVLYSTLKDEEGRQKLIDSTVEAVKKSIIYMEDGRTITVKDYVEKVLGSDWSVFESNLRKQLEASIASYLDKIDNTDGSPLARHIYLRDEALRTNDISSSWLFMFSQGFSLSIMSLYTKIYIARILKDNRLINWDIGREIARYYNYVGRFKTVVDNIAYESLRAYTETKYSLLQKILKRLKRQREELTPEKAAEEFEKIREKARKTFEHAPTEFLPLEVVTPLTMVPISEENVKHTINKRITREDKLELNIQ